MNLCIYIYSTKATDIICNNYQKNKRKNKINLIFNIANNFFDFISRFLFSFFNSSTLLSLKAKNLIIKLIIAEIKEE